MKGMLKTLAIVAGIAALVWAGYRYAPDWTGFGEYQIPADPDIERARRLWDWLELLIVPFVLALGVWWLDRRQKKTEREFEQARLEKDREIAREKRQDATLEAYFDRMTALLLEEGLGNPDASEKVKKIARTRTRVVLRRLDGKRNGHVVRFLCDAGLMSRGSPLVSLAEIDLQSSDLQSTNLEGIDLQGANLQRTILDVANLWKANLEGVDLDGASLREANLAEINLEGATLRGTDLGLAMLDGANLRGASLDRANLEGASLVGANLEGAVLKQVYHLQRADLSGALLNGTVFEEIDIKESNLRAET